MTHEALRERLLAHRQELIERLDAIEVDARHQDEPLEKDSEEQSVQLEQEEVLTALDDEGIATLRHIDQALQLMEVGSYGICAECGEEIPEGRLNAVPYAIYCIDCETDFGGG